MAAAPPVTPVDVFRHIVRFLAWLDRLEQGLIQIYSQRLVAAAQFETSELLALNQQETALQAELRQLKPKRDDLLALGQKIGFRTSDLKSLLQALRSFATTDGGIDPEQLQLTVSWLKRLETLGRDLQRQVWTNWHVIQRANRQLLEIRGLIAGDSRSSPTFGTPSRQSRSGGVLLDAKV